MTLALVPDRHRLEAFERALLESSLPVVALPLIHRFTPGLYAREILMPAGTLCTSRTHATRHLYIVLSGIVHVVMPGQPRVTLTAGHVGITEAGTKRALYIEEECRWITCHVLSPEEESRRAAGATEMELVAIIETRILIPETSDREIFQAYCDRLAAAGLPLPHETQPRLSGDE